MKQVKLFVEDVAQGMGVDQTANEWLQAMVDEIEVESIQVSLGASGMSRSPDSTQAWPVAILIVYRPNP